MADPIRQLLSQTSYAGDGVTTVWNFSFPYIDVTHVKVSLSKDFVVTQVAVSASDFPGAFQVRVLPAVPVGTEITIYRSTPLAGPLVQFSDSVQLTQQSLNLNATQAIFVAAEAQDSVITAINDSTAGVVAVAAANVARQAAADALAAVQGTVRTTDIPVSGGFSSLSAAATAVGTLGALLISSTHPTTDVMDNPFDIPVIDLRRKQLGFHSTIAPMFPVKNYPFGHDAVLRTRGSADTWLEHFHVTATTTASLAVGWNYNVPISAVTCGNQRAPGNSGTGGAEFFSPIAHLVLGRETATEELVNGHTGDWVYVDATHIHIKCTKTHSGTTDIDQGGSTLLASQDLHLVSNVTKPAQYPGYDANLRVKDLGSRISAKWPSNINTTWPQSGWQWNSPLTGCTGGTAGLNADLRFRQATTTSTFRFLGFDNTQLVTINSVGDTYVAGNLQADSLSLTADAVLNGSNGGVQIGKTTTITSTADAFVGWQLETDPLNPANTAGSLLLAGRNIANAAVNIATQNTLRATFNASGLKVAGGLGCNGKAPQAPVAVPAAATDTATAVALVNAIRSALILNGILI